MADRPQTRLDAFAWAPLTLGELALVGELLSAKLSALPETDPRWGDYNALRTLFAEARAGLDNSAAAAAEESTEDASRRAP